MIRNLRLNSRMVAYCIFPEHEYGASTAPVFRSQIFNYFYMASNLIYAKGRKIRKEDIYKPIRDKYRELYIERFGIIPEINHGMVNRLIKERLKNHSVKGLIKIIEIFFENEVDIVFDLKTILSSFFINKYAPKLRLDPNVYSNASEWNKEIY